VHSTLTYHTGNGGEAWSIEQLRTSLPENRFISSQVDQNLLSKGPGKNQEETSATGHPDFALNRSIWKIGLSKKMCLHLLASDGLAQLALMFD
jgi:hypothetical protein